MIKWNNSYFSKRLKISTAALVIGVLLIGAGITFSILQPEDASLRRWSVSLGFFFTGIGAVNFLRYRSVVQNPTAARRVELAEKDERSLMIRNRAGYSAYLLSMLISYGGLLIYSNLSQSTQGFDFFWYYLAFAALAPSVFYIIYLVWLHEHN